jgi:Ca-activated chloride channel homolog
VTVPSTPRSTTRRRRHPIRTKTLVLISVIACVLLLIGRGAAQIVSHYSCSRNQVVLNVAVSPDIAPAITRVADYFNRRQLQAAGRCVSVSVDTEMPALAAGQIDGQRPQPHPGIDAWIPDSSLWVDQARNLPVGANLIQPAGYSVALSPLMLVTPKAAAARVPAFSRASWHLLLPTSDGGPALPTAARVDLPDPSQNAAGLASLVQIGRVLGRNTAGRVRFSRFVFSTQVTSYFDDPSSLRYFVSLAAPPLRSDPITVTTEQAVLAYDEAYPHQPLAAKYPAGGSQKYGSPEMDYPYVVTTGNPVRRDAAGLFGKVLTQPYAQSVIRYAGFRSGRGVPDVFTASSGLSSQALQVATPATASEAPAALSVWNKLALSSRDLTLVDISSGMGSPASAGGPTFEQVLTQTASLGLALFPDTANIGLWEFSDDLDHGLPYKELVPIGPLSEGLGVISRRAELQRVSSALTPSGGPHAALYGSILDAYKYMQKNYKPGFANNVIVLASGLDNAPGDITGEQLLAKLTKLSANPHKVAVIVIAFSPDDDFPLLKKISLTTGGQAYQIRNPARVAQVFYQAIAHRLCGHGCLGP